MSFHKTKKRRWFWYLLSLTLFFLIGGGILFAVGIKSLTPQDVLEHPLVERQLLKRLGAEHQDLIDAVPILLGFDEKRTYLFLFLNNTELRPGGGFIGTYAVVDVEKGRPYVQVVDGADELGNRAPASWQPTPPPILKRELKVDRWYFRDSNWSPDFAVSSERARTFYAGEGGVKAQDIDAVIAFTPTVIEHVLQKIGPVTVQGIQFTSDNVTETLQREVEYDYAKRGVAFEERKQIMQPLFEEMLTRVAVDFFKESESYLSLAQALVDQKHILLYTQDESIHTRLASFDPFGRVKETENDYLLWVDANLAALKTDHAMHRHLVYEIQSTQDSYKASATMHYDHRGTFDWRTTRYRTYARVYVPVGASLEEAYVLTPYGKKSISRVDEGMEQGKQWFGTFLEIEPGDKKAIKFVYTLPKKITEDIDNGTYMLQVQKQLGTLAHSLTLNLNFDTTIVGATPAEEEREWGDDVYKVETDLLIDRNFNVELKE